MPLFFYLFLPPICFHQVFSSFPSEPRPFLDVMSSDKGKSGSGFWSMLLGVGVGTVLGAAVGVAWVLGHRNPAEEARQNRRSAASSSRPSIARTQIPKRHFKARVSPHADSLKLLPSGPEMSADVTDLLFCVHCPYSSSCSQKTTKYHLNSRPI